MLDLRSNVHVFIAAPHTEMPASYLIYSSYVSIWISLLSFMSMADADYWNLNGSWWPMVHKYLPHTVILAVKSSHKDIFWIRLLSAIELKKQWSSYRALRCSSAILVSMVTVLVSMVTVHPRCCLSIISLLNKVNLRTLFLSTV